MKTLVLIAIGVICGLLVVAAYKAECAYCPNLVCYGSDGCPDGCNCFFPSGEMQGSCVSIE